jgi:hypothetical protein
MYDGDKIVYDFPKEEGGGWLIFCPGCGCAHRLDTRWTFNGDYEKPTFRPSLLIRSGHYVPEHQSENCWCTYSKEHPDDPAPFECGVCHSFITDGQIQFLGDCTHSLKGKTVPLERF